MTSYFYFPLLIFYIIPLKYLLALSLCWFCCRDTNSFRWNFFNGDEELKELQALYRSSILNQRCIVKQPPVKLLKNILEDQKCNSSQDNNKGRYINFLHNTGCHYVQRVLTQKYQSRQRKDSFHCIFDIFDIAQFEYIIWTQWSIRVTEPWTSGECVALERVQRLSCVVNFMGHKNNNLAGLEENLPLRI